jgi:ABC-type transport system involved in multi-copper enzyme maturation permease subunit
MFSLLVQKELKAFVLSPRFAGTFLVGAILILLSVYIGIQEYRAAADHTRTTQQLADQQVRQATSWMGMTSRAYRAPDPMMIFVSGLAFDIGRWSDISSRAGVQLRHSLYSDDPIYAVFRFIDFGFIVTVVLSLFALLFTYDAVSGEREDGTLKLVFSNPLPRAKYILAKATGAWLGLTSALIVPTALAILLVLLYKVPFAAQDWVRLGILIAMAAVFCGCFVMLGLLISTLTRQSSVSFLVGLMTWVVLTLIVPRIGIITAGQIAPVPSEAEIQGQREAFARDRWNKFTTEGVGRWHQQSADDTLTDEALLARMQEEDSLRRRVEKDINDFEAGLNADLRRQKARQEKMALTLARFSPVSAFQLAAMSLAGTDLGMKIRYEDAMSAYRDQFTAYTGKQEQENPGQGGIRISIDSEKGMNVQSTREAGALDVSGIPAYLPPLFGMSAALGSLAIDLGILIVILFGCLSGSVAAFVRYDVR